MAKENYKEIFRLKEMLEKVKIPFEFGNMFDGFQLCYPRNNKSEDDFARVC